MILLYSQRKLVAIQSPICRRDEVSNATVRPYLAHEYEEERDSNQGVENTKQFSLLCLGGDVAVPDLQTRADGFLWFSSLLKA